MPIYAYKCAECGHELDVIRKVSDPPLTECPHCGKPALVKQVTAAGFQLKGGGWYVTDFRDQGSGKKKDKSKPDEPSKTDQADSKTEAKPDTKTETSDSKGKTETKTDSKSDGSPTPAPVPAASPPPASGKPSETG